MTAAIPEAAISWIVGKLHVGDPIADVRANIRARAEKITPALAPETIAAWEDHAEAVHLANRETYIAVKFGRFDGSARTKETLARLARLMP